MTTSRRSVTAAPAWRASARRTFRLAVVSALVALTLAACAPAPAPASGRLEGVVHRIGGPAVLGPDGKIIQPTPQPLEAAAVTATLRNDAGRTYTANSASGGSYAFDLPPGVYEVSATSGGGRSTTELATVTAGRTSRVDLQFLVP